jgi:Protein of unknown function (DUF4230)
VRAIILLLGVGIGLAAALLWPRLKADDPGMTLQAAITRMEPQQRLVTTSAFVQVVSRVEDLNRLWGDARVFAVAPGRIDYSVDLSGLDGDALRKAPDGKSLIVTVPDPTWTVVPDMKRLELIRAIGGLRTEAGIGNALEAQVLKRVAADFERLAASPEALKTARSQARSGVAGLLSPLVGMPVVVQFRSESGRSS